MNINNLYLAEISIIDKDNLLHTEHRLVWARTETDAMCEVYDVYNSNESQSDGSYIDVTVTDAIGKMVRF